MAPRALPSLLVPLFAALTLARPAPQEPRPAQEAVPPVRGVVTDADGVPLPGVGYRVSGFEQRVDGRWSVVHFTGESLLELTDARGRFELAGREDLRYDVDFFVEGRAPAFVQAAEPGAELVVRLAVGYDLAGRVVQLGEDGARGCAHALLELRSPSARGLWFQHRLAADAEGRFLLPGALPAPGGLPAGRTLELGCAGAVLPLGAAFEAPVDDVRVEVQIGRAGR